MENITIADIAKKAKVSIGTVSNVLNKKGNVKISTIRKVEKAAQQLGYVRNENAQVMKTGDWTTVLILVSTLTSAVSPFIIDLLHDLKLEGMDLKIIEVEPFIEHTHLINLLKQNQYKAAICLSSIKDKEILNAIPHYKLITIGQTFENTHHIELDLNSFFKNTSDLEEFTIVSDKQDFAIYEMILNRCEEERINLNVVDLEENDIPESFFSLKHKKFIVFSPNMIEKIYSFFEDSDVDFPQFVLISCKTGYHLYDSLKINKFYFSSNELTLKIIKLLQQLPENPGNDSLKETLKIYLTDKIGLSSSKNQQTIRLLLLKNPFSKALKRLAFKFTKETNIQLEITDLPFEEMNQLIMENKVMNYDIVRLDVSYFPWFGSKLFLDLAKVSEITSLLHQMKDWRGYCYVNQQLLALPADPSIQMMLYRKDVFDNPIIQKTYLEEFGEHLLPPTTYDELVKYCEFYQGIHIPEKKVPYPLSVTTGRGILVASEFLPYFYSLGGKIEYSKELFEITADPFIETLSYYKKVRKNANIQQEVWWDSEIEDFNRNETAIIIGYTNHLNQVSEIDYGYSSIPGQIPTFGGGVLGITKESKKLQESILFFKWLYQYRTQEQLAALGVCIPRTHLFDERNNYRKYPFLSFSSQNFSKGRRLQYINDKYVMNTIEIEKIIGQEINTGLEKGSSDYEILIRIHNYLNANQKKLIQKM